METVQQNLVQLWKMYAALLCRAKHFLCRLYHSLWILLNKYISNSLQNSKLFFCYVPKLPCAWENHVGLFLRSGQQRQSMNTAKHILSLHGKLSFLQKILSPFQFHSCTQKVLFLAEFITLHFSCINFSRMLRFLVEIPISRTWSEGRTMGKRRSQTLAAQVLHDTCTLDSPI